MTEKMILRHVFESEGLWYLYDAFTNDIFACDEVVAAVLKVWEQHEDAAVLADLVRKWGTAEVDRAIAEIQQLREETKALTPFAFTVEPRCPTRFDPRKYEDSITHLQLTVSEQCNLRCQYCPYTLGRPGCRLHNDAHMSRETALKATDFFLARSGEVENPSISFYGGEPLLNLAVIKAVVARVRDRAPDREIRFHLDTNGVLIDEQVAAYLNREKFFVQISLDGPREIHDRYRRTRSGEGSFDSIIRGIGHLLDDDPESPERIRYNSVLTPPYDLMAVVEFFQDFPPHRERGIDAAPEPDLDFADVSGMPFEPRDVTGPADLDPTPTLTELRQNFIQECTAGRYHDLSRAVRSFFDEGIIKYYHRPRGTLPDRFFPTGTCQPGQRKVHVRADGSLLACEKVPDAMFIGHVDSGLDLPRIETLYDQLLDAVAGRCGKCWALRHCSICFMHLDAEGKVPEEICESTRAAAERTFRDYLPLQQADPKAREWLKDTTMK